MVVMYRGRRWRRRCWRSMYERNGFMRIGKCLEVWVVVVYAVVIEVDVVLTTRLGRHALTMLYRFRGGWVTVPSTQYGQGRTRSVQTTHLVWNRRYQPSWCQLSTVRGMMLPTSHPTFLAPCRRRSYSFNRSVSDIPSTGVAFPVC